MRRTMTAILGLIAATWSMWAPADVAVMAVRLGAKDVVVLAKFYDAAFGLKEIDRVGQPPTEIIMRYGASVAAAKAGSSPGWNVSVASSYSNTPYPHPPLSANRLLSFTMKSTSLWVLGCSG